MNQLATARYGMRRSSARERPPFRATIDSLFIRWTVRRGSKKDRSELRALINRLTPFLRNRLPLIHPDRIKENGGGGTRCGEKSYAESSCDVHEIAFHPKQGKERQLLEAIVRYTNRDWHVKISRVDFALDLAERSWDKARANVQRIGNALRTARTRTVRIRVGDGGDETLYWNTKGHCILAYANEDHPKFTGPTTHLELRVGFSEPDRIKARSRKDRLDYRRTLKRLGLSGPRRDARSLAPLIRISDHLSSVWSRAFWGKNGDGIDPLIMFARYRNMSRKKLHNIDCFGISDADPIHVKSLDPKRIIGQIRCLRRFIGVPPMPRRFRRGL